MLLGPARRPDISHPAFAKLFLETEWVPGRRGPDPGAVGRMRSASEQVRVWALHVAAVDDSSAGVEAVGETQYETDRARFLGRGPHAGQPGRAWSTARPSRGPSAPVIDPVLSLRRRFRLQPGGSVGRWR